MKKKIAILASVISLSVISTIPVFASGWQKNETGWWYGTNADNSTWYSNGWQWIDGNGDGIAECYYFDANGYMAANTVIDDSAVDGNGVWTVNGVVQTKQVGGQQDNKDLQRWIGIYEKTDNKNCRIEIYDANEGGLTVEYKLLVGTLLAVNEEHHLAFQNGDTTRAYGIVEDPVTLDIDAETGIADTYELMADGNIQITFDKATQVELSEFQNSSYEYLAAKLNGVYRKTGTEVQTIAERKEEHRRNLEAAGYNEDGTLTEEGKMYDHDGDGQLNTNEAAELRMKGAIDYYNNNSISSGEDSAPVIWQ